MPIAFMCKKSRSHSFGPQFWCGMSWLISSIKVPVISMISFMTFKKIQHSAGKLLFDLFLVLLTSLSLSPPIFLSISCNQIRLCATHHLYIFYPVFFHHPRMNCISQHTAVYFLCNIFLILY